MNEVQQALASTYAAALREYLAGRGEHALAQGYEIGRDALRAGVGLTELVGMQCEVLGEILAGAGSVDEARAMLGHATELVQESLAPFEMTIRGYQEANERLQRAMTTVQNRSEELAAKNEELAAAKEKAERESWFKSRFLANMSHELRTPLNAILGFSELMEQQVGGTLSERHLGYVRNVLSSGRHLLRLVNDVLDLSKIEAGKMDLHREPTVLPALVDAAHGVVRPLADKQGVTLAADLPRDLPAVDVDPVRTTQVLYNLLSNAIKFTPAGGVVRVAARADGPMVRVEVSDTGVGMEPQELSRLFQEFERIDVRVAGERREGTGLGLALTRRLVELQGGRVEVASEKGKGSTFSFTVPVCGGVRG